MQYENISAYVIYDRGENQSYVGRIINEEIRRQRAEEERQHVVEASRNRLLARRSAAWAEAMRRPRNPLSRLRDRLATLWAVAWGTVLCLGEALHLWVPEDERGNRPC